MTLPHDEPRRDPQPHTNDPTPDRREPGPAPHPDEEEERDFGGSPRRAPGYESPFDREQSVINTNPD